MSAISFISLFETKSARVKGLAFHPRRSWVLASLHNGVIQLWDYRLRTLIDRFGEHDGPVRSVDFHPTQPLFASGGDDNKIKVWNYKERRCLFTLHGHLDYIRTVQFHHEYPWILSCSDDQCIRIWNWQSRQCISVITGHGHYVMSARFHPTEDLVVSSSLDQTVRVWDISGLRRKNITPMHGDEDSRLQADIFGTSETVVKFVLEGHDRGVNWACFHPTLQYIISGADDRQIKLWRMNGTKAYELETLRGHYNNVSNIVFHPKEDIMISNSEDRTIRVWDMTKRTALYTHKRDHDRFWILASHPKLNLFVAGHDSGLVVFKLEREKAPSTLFRENLLLFVRDNTLLSSTGTLRMLNLKSNEEQPLFSIKRATCTGMTPRQLLSHPQSAMVIATYSNESGSRYELFTIPKPGQSPDSVNQSGRGGAGLSVAWVKRDRFAVLSKSSLILINDLNTNETTKRITPPHPTDKLYSALTDSILLRSDDRLTLYDVQQERVLSMIKLIGVKDVIWDQNPQAKSPLVAIISRGAVVLTNRRLETVCSVLETLKVKSGAWDENGTFIYSTLCHIKYCLPSGDHGIVRTLDRPIYIVAVKDNTVHCLDRSGKSHALLIDTTEYMFKHALSTKNFSQVSAMVKNSNLIGQSIIGYLQKKGYPEIALCFVKDEKTRFNLALECATANNIEIAHQSATVLNDPECWSKLGAEALRQGNHQVVEKAYQQTLDFERLSHLYLITGNTVKLNKMLHIAAEKRGDDNAQFYNSLLLGNVHSRVQTLERVGQLQLAYVTAINHGLDELADDIRQKVIFSAFQKHREAGGTEEDFVPPPLPGPNPDAKLFNPPVPILRLDRQNWPITRVARGPLDDVVSGSATGTVQSSKFGIEPSSAAGAAWGDDDDGLTDSDDEAGAGFKGEASGDEAALEDKGDGWGSDSDAFADEPDEKDETDGELTHAAPTFPTPGQPRIATWARFSQLASHRASAGKFDEAMALLNQQVGIINFEPLKDHFLKLFYSSSIFMTVNAALPERASFLEENGDGERSNIPRNLFNLQQQITKLNAAYASFTDGKFADSKRLFLQILQALPVVVATSPRETEEIEQLIGICREYIVGLTLELTRKDLSAKADDQATQLRCAELSAYFTHVDLNAVHLQLTLKVAINILAKVKNYGTVEELANRLLALNPPKALQQHAEKALKVARSKGSADVSKFNYDPHNPFVLCCTTLLPIYQGSPKTTCPFCNATYTPSHEGQLCQICQLAQIGKKGTGFVSIAQQKKRS